MCAMLYTISFSIVSFKQTWLCKEKHFHPSSCCMGNVLRAVCDVLIFACLGAALGTSS